MKPNCIPRIGLLSAFWIAMMTMSGCGGGGGGSSSGGGGSNSLLVASDVRGLQGELVNSVTASQTPQSVQINVNGDVQSISNVIVAANLSAGQDVALIKQGSKLLNINILNPASGVSIGSTGFKVPVSSDCTLQAGVLHSFGVALVTPPASWHGMSMPNGFQVTVLVDANHAGEIRATLNTNVTRPSSVGGTANGTTSVTYTSPNPFFSMSIGLASSAFSIGIGGPNGPAATNGTVTNTWTCQRHSNDTPVFTTATLDVNFSNSP